MALREIIKLPDLRLRLVSKPVGGIDDEVRTLVAASVHDKLLVANPSWLE